MIAGSSLTCFGFLDFGGETDRSLFLGVILATNFGLLKVVVKVFVELVETPLLGDLVAGLKFEVIFFGLVVATTLSFLCLSLCEEDTGLFTGRLGVGMLLGTVALIVGGVSVGLSWVGGSGTEYFGGGRTVVSRGRNLLSLGEWETCLVRFILFISWARAVKPSIKISSLPSSLLKRDSISVYPFSSSLTFLFFSGAECMEMSSISWELR